MKRQVITIQESMIIYAPHHGEVWMTAWEIAELLNVTGTTVNNTIKRIWKQGGHSNNSPWIKSIVLS